MSQPICPRPCPICKAPATPAYRPFCSLRCANVDLGRWFGGGYAVPGAGDDGGGDDGEGEGGEGSGQADDGA